MADVLKHRLVPKHEILTKEGIESILAEFGITLDRLPRMKADDPVAIAISAKPGDVVKIERLSQTASTSIYYRLVTGA